jgi:hypothetical protein
VEDEEEGFVQLVDDDDVGLGGWRILAFRSTTTTV